MFSAIRRAELAFRIFDRQRAILRTFTTLLLLLLIGFLPARAFAPPAGEPLDYSQPLGIALETWAYPYPVHFFGLSVEGQAVRMAYMDVPAQGKANGQTVVLMHGKNFPSSYWEKPIAFLSRAGYRVVVPDQIGFINKSSCPDVSYSFDMLATNTMALLDSIKIDKAVFVGHSTCGMLAVRIARTYPARVTRLVLEDPIGLEDYRQFVMLPPLGELIQNEQNQTTEKYRAFVHRYFVTWKPDYERFVEVRMRLQNSGEFPRWAKSSALLYYMIVQQPIRYEFARLVPPTLLIVGEGDQAAALSQYAPPEQRNNLGHVADRAREVIKEVPHGKLIVVPNCGHIPHLEQPDAFQSALLPFLATPQTP